MNAIVETARSYLGTPFVHQGRHRDYGVDCAGLLTCVAYDIELGDVRVADYGRRPDPERAKTIIEQHMDPVPFRDLAAGDVMSFVIVRSVQHYGIVTEINPHQFVHAYEPAGKVIEVSLSPQWRLRLRGCYRFRGVK